MSWAGRSGGGPTRRSRGDATTGNGVPNPQISYNCSTGSSSRITLVEPIVSSGHSVIACP